MSIQIPSPRSSPSWTSCLQAELLAAYRHHAFSTDRVEEMQNSSKRTSPPATDTAADVSTARRSRGELVDDNGARPGACNASMESRPKDTRR